MRAAASMTRRAFRTGLALTVVLSWAAAGVAETPDFTGVWQLDPKRSEDAKAKAAAVVGGAHTVGNESKERERVNLRNWLLPTVEHLDHFEVAQSAQEIKLVGGEEEPRVRIFRFDGSRTRIGEADVKFKYKTKWEGAVLTIEEEAEKGKGKIIDTLAFDADGKSLVHTLRFDARGLKAPLDIRLVYIRIR